MRKAISVGLCLVLCFLASGVQARCYSFSNGDTIRVCVRGDSWAHRKKARQVCRQVKGSHCGAISRSSEECRAPALRCYDQDGKAHESLSGY